MRSALVSGRPCCAASLCVAALFAVHGCGADPDKVADTIRSGSHSEREAAVDLLQRLPSDSPVREKGLAALVERLSEESWDERARAARALGLIGDARAVEPLLAIVTDYEPAQYEVESPVRAAAIEALGAIGDTRAVEPLIEVLRCGSLEPAMRGMPWALRDLVAPGLLLYSLEEHLADIHGQPFRDLRASGCADPEPVTLIESGYCRLMKLVEEADGEQQLYARFLPPLVEALSDPEPVARRQAEVVARFATLEKHRELSRCLRELVRFEYLGEQPTGGECSEDDESLFADWAVRSAAATALGDIGDDRATPALLDAVRDWDVRVREHAGIALGRLGGEAVVAALSGRLEETPRQLRDGLAAAFGELGGERSVEVLVTLLEEGPGHVRVAALGALGKVGTPAAADAVIRALEGRSEDATRRAAATSLAGFDSGETDEALFRALERGDLAAVAGAYRFFIGEGREGTEGTLIAALNVAGDDSMALSFLSSHNEKLEEAARVWAKKHGYVIQKMQIPGRSGRGRTGWGSQR